MARREQGRRLFSPGELVILVVSVAGAVAGVVALAAGVDHDLNRPESSYQHWRKP